MSTEIPLLRQIYDELYIKRLVKNQRDLSEQTAKTYIKRTRKGLQDEVNRIGGW